MENLPLFSVLIANYNNAAYLNESIGSVINQTYTNWELVIIDDCSTDNSAQIIGGWAGSDSRIKFYKNERNCGQGYTKRKLVELSEGEICGILDPDDALTDDAIKVTINAHLANNKASLVYSNCYICGPELNITSTAIVNSVPPGKTFLDCVGSENISVSHFTTFKRSFYNKTAGIDGYLLRAPDQDLYYKLEEVGLLHHIDEVLYKYRIHDGGLSMGRGTIKSLSWHFYVIIEACKRRGLKLEDYIPLLVEKEIIKPIKRTRDYAVGSAVLKPFRFIKKLIN